MPSDTRFFDDFARLASSAMGTAAGLRQEMEAIMRERVERWMREMAMPTRDELDEARALAAEARQRQEDLADRVAALEAKIATLLAERELAHAAPAPKRPAKRAQAESGPTEPDPAG